jgi:hypothetical protein
MVKTLIRVTRGGCGVKYADGNGVERYALKTPESGAFECEIEQAKHFVALGMAEYVAAPAIPVNNQDGDKFTGHLDAALLESMSYDDLKKLAADMGVEPEGKKKADYIKALLAVEVEAGEEIDGDDLPDFDAADPA